MLELNPQTLRLLENALICYQSVHLDTLSEQEDKMIEMLLEDLDNAKNILEEEEENRTNYLDCLNRQFDNPVGKLQNLIDETFPRN